jgi:hypothetical protein
MPAHCLHCFRTVYPEIDIRCVVALWRNCVITQLHGIRAAIVTSPYPHPDSYRDTSAPVSPLRGIRAGIRTFARLVPACRDRHIGISLSNKGLLRYARNDGRYPHRHIGTPAHRHIITCVYTPATAVH